MKLRDWDIWHVYSSFLSSSEIDLMAAGDSLARSGVAECVMERDGRTWWRAGTQARTGITSIQLESGAKRARISLEPDHPDWARPEAFAAEAWFQSSHFRFNELRVFGDSSQMPPPYLRIMLGEFHASSESSGFTAVLYPVIKLFESGVILVQWRVIAPNREVDLEQFIDRFVNLSAVRFNNVEVPPMVSAYAPDADAGRDVAASLATRLRNAKLSREHHMAIKQLSHVAQGDDFTATLAPLSRTDGHTDTLASLAQTLFAVVGFIISEPRSGLNYVFRGQRELTLPGEWWTGRPHVYLLDYDGQEEVSSETIGAVGAQFGWILGRHPGRDEHGIRYLPSDLRPFDDYSVFITLSASLCAWSTSGVERQALSADANRGHLIYEQHATAEMLEYGSILHRALLARASAADRPRAVHVSRRALTALRGAMSDASHFGEIRDLLRHGWQALGVDELRERIAETLAVKESEAVHLEVRRAERIGRWLACLFGVLATPALAVEVVAPAWSVLGWWTPHDSGGTKLFFVGIAFATVIVGIALLSWLGSKRRE